MARLGRVDIEAYGALIEDFYNDVPVRVEDVEKLPVVYGVAVLVNLYDDVADGPYVLAVKTPVVGKLATLRK